MASTVLLTLSSSRLRSLLVYFSSRTMRETYDLLAAHQPASLAIFALALRFGVERARAFLEAALRFLLVLHERVDAADGLPDARLQNLFGDLFFVEDDDFLDVADAALEVFAEADDFANDDGRARDRLHDAELSALDALGDFDFAFAGEAAERFPSRADTCGRGRWFFRGCRA